MGEASVRSAFQPSGTGWFRLLPRLCCNRSSSLTLRTARTAIVPLKVATAKSSALQRLCSMVEELLPCCEPGRGGSLWTLVGHRKRDELTESSLFGTGASFAAS